MKRLLVVCGFGALALGLAAPVWAAGPEEQRGVTSDGPAALEARIAAGGVAYRDPVTWEIVVATPKRVDDLRQSLAPLFQRPAVAPVEERPDGTVRVDTEGFVSHVHLQRIDLDGGRTTACVDTLDAAVEFMLGLQGPNHQTEASAGRPAVVE